jgi:CRP-like cAMP-binding protein
MTATVMEDAELVHWSPDAMNSLLRKRPDFCQQLLTVLGERMAENQKVESIACWRRAATPAVERFLSFKER